MKEEIMKVIESGVGKSCKIELMIQALIYGEIIL